MIQLVAMQITYSFCHRAGLKLSEREQETDIIILPERKWYKGGKAAPNDTPTQGVTSMRKQLRQSRMEKKPEESRSEWRPMPGDYGGVLARSSTRVITEAFQVN